MLQGQRWSGFYARMALIWSGIGIPLNALSASGMIALNFDLVTGAFWNSPYQLGRVAVALGHASPHSSCSSESGSLRWLTDRLAAVGQMALSNYISNSIVYGLSSMRLVCG